MDSEDRIGKIAKLVSWLVRIEMLRIGSEVIPNPDISPGYKSTYMALVGKAVETLHGPAARDALLDEMTAGGYSVIKKAMDDGASDDELDMLAKGLVNKEKGTLQ